MKKLLTLILALSMMLAGIALADVPDPSYFEGDTEQTEAAEGPDNSKADEKVSASADANTEYIVPEGTRAYQYMLQLVDNTGFMIADWTFTDTAQATEAVEKSVRIPASGGMKMLVVQYVVRVPGYANLNLADIACRIVDGNGKEYDSSLWLESAANEISYDSVKHSTVDTADHAKAYLIPADGVSYTFVNSSSRVGYIPLDCIAEIPEEIIGSDLPLYIIILNMGETPYYVRIQ